MRRKYLRAIYLACGYRACTIVLANIHGKIKLRSRPIQAEQRKSAFFMIIRVHGFNWGIYAERVMPAFASWLINRDETAIHQLFERTRCPLEEQFLPKPMQRLYDCPRTKTFVDSLPPGTPSSRQSAK